MGVRLHPQLALWAKLTRSCWFAGLIGSNVLRVYRFWSASWQAVLKMIHGHVTDSRKLGSRPVQLFWFQNRSRAKIDFRLLDVVAKSWHRR